MATIFIEAWCERLCTANTLRKKYAQHYARDYVQRTLGLIGHCASDCIPGTDLSLTSSSLLSVAHSRLSIWEFSNLAGDSWKINFPLEFTASGCYPTLGVRVGALIFHSNLQHLGVFWPCGRGLENRFSIVIDSIRKLSDPGSDLGAGVKSFFFCAILGRSSTVPTVCSCWDSPFNPDLQKLWAPP